MSFSGRQVDSFIGPLHGHTITFLVDGRQTNLAFARSVLSNMARNKRPCTVLDIDTLYSSTSDYVFAPLSEEEARFVEVVVPEPDSDLEGDIAGLLGTSPDRTLIIDSLNSLYHLLSTGGRSSRNRNLAFVMALLSYVARAEKRTFLFTMYRREGATRFGRGKSISDLSDLTVSVSLKDEALALRCERGSAWSGRDLFVPIP